MKVALTLYNSTANEAQQVMWRTSMRRRKEKRVEREGGREGGKPKC
jgi:hypothetical protein